MTWNSQDFVFSLYLYLTDSVQIKVMFREPHKFAIKYSKNTIKTVIKYTNKTTESHPILGWQYQMSKEGPHKTLRLCQSRKAGYNRARWASRVVEEFQNSGDDC